jgi:hypothetical protein
MIVRDFNTLLSPIGHQTKINKINKEILELNDIIDHQIDLTNIYGAGTSPKIHHILGHKASFSKNIEVEITSVRPQWNKTRT